MSAVWNVIAMLAGLWAGSFVGYVFFPASWWASCIFGLFGMVVGSALYLSFWELSDRRQK